MLTNENLKKAAKALFLHFLVDFYCAEQILLAFVLSRETWKSVRNVLRKCFIGISVGAFVKCVSLISSELILCPLSFVSFLKLNNGLVFI